MALTPEQQADIDFQNALESARCQPQMAMNAKQAKIEAIKLAKETLIENSRSKPVSEREITAADITTFADTLIAYVDA